MDEESLRLSRDRIRSSYCPDADKSGEILGRQFRHRNCIFPDQHRTADALAKRSFRGGNRLGGGVLRRSHAGIWLRAQAWRTLVATLHETISVRATQAISQIAILLTARRLGP